MTKKFNECVMCDNNATGVILDECAVEYLDVCDDCYKEVFVNVANSGAEIFYEWAEEMFGMEKAYGLTKDIFGIGALSRVGYKEVASARADEPYITLFTYGILSYPDNIRREGGTDIVENATISGHEIYLYNGSFPITKMTNNPEHKVYGTLFKVPESQVLYSYDITEGYEPDRHPSQNMYNRIEVDVTTPEGEVVQAQMYYANQRMFAQDIKPSNKIPTGSFKDRHLAKSWGKRK
jgi:hypothetical protein